MTAMIHDDETWMRELLAPLDRIEPVGLPVSKRRPGARRPLAIAALVGVALVLATGVTLAADVNPFSRIAAFVGIGAADHARTPQDALTPTAAAQVQKINQRLPYAPAPLRRVLPKTARLVGQFPGGHNIYVLATTTNDLCVVIDGVSAAIGPPPRAGGEPTTIGWMQRGPHTPPISWGIARDGVASVSFRGGGRMQTVRVVNNVWVYEGPNSALGSITVHYADGTSRTITH